MKPAILTSSLLACAVVSGCALGPQPERPAVSAPAAWKEATPRMDASETREPPVAWWRVFEDPVLNAIEAQVLASNHDLQRSLARVAEARALARISAADRLPGLTGGKESTRRHTSANQPAALGGDRTGNEFHSGLDLSFELDLWKRNRHDADAARSEAYSEEQDMVALQLTLTAEAARVYHELRSVDVERRVIEATRGLRRDALALQVSRYRAGLVNEVDVSRARTELAQVEAELHAAERQRARLEHALAVLAGESPSSFTVVAHSRFVLPPPIPAGLPSELLQRRPDVAAAEHRLEAARARIAVAKAEFFPRISLTGSAGFASTELGDLTNGNSAVWSFGPRVHLPLFDGGRNRANLNAAEARYEQTAAQYQTVALNAFREVEDALSDLRTLSLQNEAVQQALAASRATATLAHERYQRGLSSYLEVVDAQRGVFSGERAEAQLKGQQAAATILLAKALGGGWRSARAPDDRVSSLE
jgi:multidrug efflux system outer membrane protein